MQAEVDDLTFEEWWPELGDAVRAWLLRRRVPPHLVDDIVQETGLRLFKMWDEIDAMRSPRGLAFTIASNLLWDERNRHSAREIVGEVPEQSCEDVERAGIARLELARVKRAMGRLNPQQRSVLLAEIGHDSGPSGSPDAVKMMRMRARRRLHALLESAPAGALIPLLSPRRWWRTFRLARRGSALHAPAVMMVAVCTTIAVVGVPPTAPAQGAPAGMSVANVHRADVAAAAAISGALADSSATQVGQPGSGTTGRMGTADLSTGQRFEFDVGEGTPVRGRGHVSVEPTDDFGVTVHECYAEPEGQTGVRAKCHAQAGDKEVDVDVTLTIDP